MSAPVQFVEIDVLLHGANRRIRHEVQLINPEDTSAPLLVFLHEGLGSVSAWRDFPARACAALACRGLVYSRYGYGQSTPRPHDEAWPPSYLHDQAHQVLPALFRALGIDTKASPPILFGHSDGGTIALLYAARFHQDVAGIIVAAPHIFVEDMTLDSLKAVRELYRVTDMRQKLAKLHADPDSAFGGWNDAWLNPAFRSFNIEAEISTIRCPVLAIQGERDEYASMAQVDGIGACVPTAQVLALPKVGHSPHKDATEALLNAMNPFINSLTL